MRGQLDSALVVAWLARVALDSVQQFSHIWRCPLHFWHLLDDQQVRPMWPLRRQLKQQPFDLKTCLRAVILLTVMQSAEV